MSLTPVDISISNLIGFEVLKAASMKMAVFWVVTPCRLVEVYQRLRGTYCLHHQDLIALMMEATSTSETLVNFYQTTRRYNPEDSHLHKSSLQRSVLFDNLFL
jgi:hypothetical protein